jgi:fructosamine-3-kinase
LWPGNSSELQPPASGPGEGNPSLCLFTSSSFSTAIFDPASFYGHDEYELGIATMFGGYAKPFFEGYHSLIPKKPGFDKRNKVYQLFHYLNHWLVIKISTHKSYSYCFGFL